MENDLTYVSKPLLTVITIIEFLKHPVSIYAAEVPINTLLTVVSNLRQFRSSLPSPQSSSKSQRKSTETHIRPFAQRNSEVGSHAANEREGGHCMKTQGIINNNCAKKAAVVIYHAGQLSVAQSNPERG